METLHIQAPPRENHDEVTKLLETGKTILLRDGWHQGGTFNGDNGEVCMIGALLKEMGDGQMYKTYSQARDALAREVGTAAPINFSNGRRSVALWNDQPSTTFEDVIAIYDKAIAKRKAA